MAEIKNKEISKHIRIKFLILMLVIMLPSRKVYATDLTNSANSTDLDIEYVDLKKKYDELFAFSSNTVDEYESLYNSYIESLQESMNLKDDLEYLHAKIEEDNRKTLKLTFGLIGVGFLCVIEGVLIGFLAAN